MLRRMHIPAALKLAAALALASACQAEPAPGSSQRRAEDVAERTRTTRATYALYGWNWVRDPDGSPRQGWSAEFHRGALHRVETPDVRVVADCVARTGTMVNIRTNETVTGARVSNAACGMNANPEVVSLEWLGRREARFGPVDMVRLIDPNQERSYAVDRHGVLVAAEIFPRDAGESYCVQNEAVAVERTLPEEDIFSVESLARSVVPERYRAAPGRPVGNLWLREPSCLGAG